MIVHRCAVCSAEGDEPAPCPKCKVRYLLSPKGLGAHARDAVIGSILAGKWALCDRIAAGNQGVVYAGVQIATGRPVAVKVLRPELPADGQGPWSSSAMKKNAIERFDAEIAVLSRLHHPNIVNVLDHDEVVVKLASGLAAPKERVRYMVQEFVDGPSLADALTQSGGRLPLARALDVLAQVADALVAAHVEGVFHRDVKPANVLLCPWVLGDFVKLLDFGLARQVGEPGVSLDGQVVGSPNYMAPEQASGSWKPAPRADVYALATLCYEVITGRLPFTVEIPSVTMIIMAKMQQDPLPLTRAIADPLPPGLAALIDQGLTRDVELRISSVEEIRDGLVAARNQACEPAPAQDALAAARARWRRSPRCTTWCSTSRWT